ncbi:arsenate reductase [Alphaproteobacteria bacterium]|nr:arsenate reductase [Alphaproteobacteria bacterium]
MKIYGLKNCDSCKKTLNALQSSGHSVEFIDLRATPVSIEQLQRWLGEHGDAVLVNRKSTTWRGLDDQARQQPVLALLMANPTLLKRPVIESGDNSFVGWTAEVQMALGLA